MDGWIDRWMGRCVDELGEWAGGWIGEGGGYTGFAVVIISMTRW